jgi:hypothetical protein
LATLVASRLEAVKATAKAVALKWPRPGSPAAPQPIFLSQKGGRLIGSERLGSFAPVKVSDQAIYNRIERAAMPLQWLFDHVSVWLRRRLASWEDRHLAPWATAVYAADASTRFLPWLRQLSQGDTRLLVGQISALFEVVPI